MKWFEVTLIKRTSTTVELAANSAEEAQYEAIYRLMRGKIELDGGRDFDDIETTAVEIEAPAVSLSIGRISLRKSKLRSLPRSAVTATTTHFPLRRSRSRKKRRKMHEKQFPQP